MKPFLLLILFCIIVSPVAYAQNHSTSTSISGIVQSLDGKSLEGVSVYLTGTNYFTETNNKGEYKIVVPHGSYQMICSALGYEKSVLAIVLKTNQNLVQNIKLKVDSNTDLKEVNVVAKTAVQEIRESPYNVVALDAKSLYNSTSDLAHMLNKASGVRIRETGGVGSNMSISLNGFTGRHIKIFMDGVPMEGFGSAFQLNNIPVNIADRIEIYKGVVPVEFGADAMGGVINVVTNQSANTYLDASYSTGSFNTHKSNLSMGHTTDKGLTFQLNAFQNYSDNNYRVKTEVLNVNTGNFSNEQWVSRFNDGYHNETIIAKAGFVNKPWADRLILGLTLGNERAEIQNSNLMKIVFGKRERQGTTVAPSLTYAKKNLFTDNLNVSLTANYNRNYNQNIDTAARQYNWLGDYRQKSSVGESVYTLGKFYNNNASATANLTYQIAKKHAFVINDVISGFSRKNADEAALIDNPENNTRRENIKNVLGASYRLQYSEKFNATAFTKLYTQHVTGSMDTVTAAGGAAAYAQQMKAYHTTGYGLATTYFLNDLQFKLSLEKAYRLPTENELFGDEVLETGNASLRAENSMNYNFGISYNHQLNKNQAVYIDVTSYYRDIHDYIRRQVDQRYGTAGYTNHGKVRNIGVDAELRYYYKNLLTLGGNVTYQDIRNKELYVSATSTQQSVTYNDRMPNVPYFFGNADAAFNFNNIGGKGNVLTLGYTFNYIGRFFLLWESQGSSSTKNELPKQVFHDFNMSYMLKNGKYNIAFEARNFTDALLYDNFSLQKPGRSFALKLRYFLNKQRTL